MVDLNMNKEFTKKVNVWKLHRELVEAGFDIEGVSYDEKENKTIVHLKDGETKDPTSVVKAHIYTEPKEIDWKAEFEAADPSKKLRILAKRVGIIELTNKEIEEGKIY